MLCKYQKYSWPQLCSSRFTVEARFSHFSPHFRKTQRCVRWCLAGLFVARPQGLEGKESERETLCWVESATAAAPFSIYRMFCIAKYFMLGEIYGRRIWKQQQFPRRVAIYNLWMAHTHTMHSSGRPAAKCALCERERQVGTPSHPCARSDGTARTQRTRNVHALCTHTPHCLLLLLPAIKINQLSKID